MFRIEPRISGPTQLGAGSLQAKKCALFPEYYVMPSNPREHLAAICGQRAARRVLECKNVWNILYLLSLSLPIHRSLCLLISFANSLSIVTIQ